VLVELCTGYSYSLYAYIRRRYRNLLSSQIAATVDDPADVLDEVRTLFSALGG
jgi:hypothetical protein